MVILKKIVYSAYYNEWNEGIGNFPVLRSYVTFKHRFLCEDYLLKVHDFKLRKCLAQLRLSSHNLSIEKGRHCKPKILVEKRLCKFCNINCIESEEHFLLHCPPGIALTILKKELNY